MQSIDERFWDKVNKAGPVPEHRPELGPCWLWTAHTNRADGRGYGSIKIDGRHVRAHRLSFEWALGPIPDGLTLDHLCRVRSCVRPTHLEPVTGAENTRRGREWTRTYARQGCCIRGHPFDEANTRLRPTGWMECRACDRDRKQRTDDPRRSHHKKLKTPILA